jgi:hypothetical protein
MKRLIAAAALFAITRGAPAQMSAPFARADTAGLRHTLDGIAQTHHGVLGYYVSNLDTGERLSLRADETFPTASLIKVPILVTLYDLAEQKQLSLDDPLTVLKIDQVPGSGVLQFILGNNADAELMQRSIGGMTVPDKTGATDSVRTECALFRLQSRVVACGFTKQNADIRWVVDNEAQLSLGRIGAAVVAAWPKR